MLQITLLLFTIIATLYFASVYDVFDLTTIMDQRYLRTVDSPLNGTINAFTQDSSFDDTFQFMYNDCLLYYDHALNQSDFDYGLSSVQNSKNVQVDTKIKQMDAFNNNKMSMEDSACGYSLMTEEFLNESKNIEKEIIFELISDIACARDDDARVRDKLDNNKLEAKINALKENISSSLLNACSHENIHSSPWQDDGFNQYAYDDHDHIGKFLKTDVEEENNITDSYKCEESPDLEEYLRNTFQSITNDNFLHNDKDDSYDDIAFETINTDVKIIQKI